MTRVKQIDFKYNELGTCEHAELRRDMSCYRGEELAKIVLANMDKYVTVATPSLSGPLSKIREEAFRLTNSIDYSWYENEEAYPTEAAMKGCRSTSVGDIVEIAGVSWMVDGYGWICLDDVEVA